MLSEATCNSARTVRIRKRALWKGKLGRPGSLSKKAAGLQEDMLELSFQIEDKMRINDELSLYNHNELIQNFC